MKAFPLPHVMSIQQQIRLRYRSEGHLRFDIPKILCAPELGDQLVQKLRGLEGIYRVDLFSRQGKLSIRYLETVCDFNRVIRRLHALIREMCAPAAPTRTTSNAALPPQGKTGDFGPLRGLRDKLREGWETLIAAGIMVRRGLGLAGGAAKKGPPWLSEFLNDLLMLYLIKIHWHSILYLWLPNPWQYRYEWAATFYMIYLSVQSRLPKPA